MDYFDLHCDTITTSLDRGLELDDVRLALSLKKRGSIERWTQLFAIFIHDGMSASRSRRAYREYLEWFGKCFVSYSDVLAQCKSAQEMQSAHELGKCAAILSVENAAALGDNADNVFELEKDGVKVMSLTWNGENEFAFGIHEGGSLKPQGRRLVENLKQTGITPDISHLSDEGVFELLSLYSGAVIATHSNLRYICKNKRNLTDEFFCELVRRGGLVGLNFYVLFLDDDGEPEVTALLKNIYRMLELGGEKTICIGSDFDGADMPDFCRDIGSIPSLYKTVAAEFGKNTADDIFYNNAEAFFINNL